MGGSRIGLIVGWIGVFAASAVIYLQNHDAITMRIWWEGEGRAWLAGDGVVSSADGRHEREDRSHRHGLLKKPSSSPVHAGEDQDPSQSPGTIVVTSQPGGIFRFYDDKVVMDLSGCDDRTGPFSFTLTFENGTRIRVRNVDPLLIVRLVHRDPEILNNISEIRGVAAKQLDDLGRAIKDPFEGVLYVFVWPAPHLTVDEAPEFSSAAHEIIVYAPDADETSRTYVHAWRRGVRLVPRQVLMPDPYGELEPVEVFFQEGLFDYLLKEQQMPYVEETLRYFFEARKRPIHVVIHVLQRDDQTPNDAADAAAVPARTSVVRTADGYYVLVLTDNWWVSIQPSLQRHLETMMKHAIDPLGLRKIDPNTKAQKIAEMLFEFFWSRWEEQQFVQRRQSLWYVFDSLNIEVVSDARPLDALLWDLLEDERRLTLTVKTGPLMQQNEEAFHSSGETQIQADWPHSFVLSGVPAPRMFSLWDMMRFSRTPRGGLASVTERWDYRAGGVLERMILHAASLLGSLPAFDHDPGRLYRMFKMNGGAMFDRTRILTATIPLDPSVFLAVFFSIGVTSVWLWRFR